MPEVIAQVHSQPSTIFSLLFLHLMQNSGKIPCRFPQLIITRYADNEHTVLCLHAEECFVAVSQDDALSTGQSERFPSSA